MGALGEWVSFKDLHLCSILSPFFLNTVLAFESLYSVSPFHGVDRFLL